MLLLSLDPDFKVEEAFWTSLRGERGLKALQSRILKCLPNDGAPKSLEASIQAMDTLAKTLVFEYCGRGVAGQFDTILGWLQSMKSGRSPTFGSGLDGDFLQQVLRRLAFVCSWSTSAGSSGGGLRYDKQAIETIMETVLAKECGETRLVRCPSVARLQLVVDPRREGDYQAVDRCNLGVGWSGVGDS